MYPSQIEFLSHILDECHYLISESEQSTYEDLIENPRLSRAICRSLEIIGEASSKLHPDIKIKYHLVPWREMSDLRNRIIHHYFGVDYEIVWNILSMDIPELKEWITIILESESGA
jgi:uncharacterized protein with HEPN domain